MPADKITTDASGTDIIDPLELEALTLILEHSLKVHTAQQFFCWSQSLLQTVIRHELLICGLRHNESTLFNIASFSPNGNESGTVGRLFGQDTMLPPQLLKTWEENRFRPFLLDLRRAPTAAGGPLGRELTRMGCSDLLVHGTHDAFGRTVSIFIFACQPGAVTQRQCYLAALLIPSLHAAWMYTLIARQMPGGQQGQPAGDHELLTSREQEVLGWICQGKSNIEIGMILKISPLTVKKHVQKILRRLNVLNRAQAVGKALVLRILDAGQG